jgi:hypothetical protein
MDWPEINPDLRGKFNNLTEPLQGRGKWVIHPMRSAFGGAKLRSRKLKHM